MFGFGKPNVKTKRSRAKRREVEAETVPVTGLSPDPVTNLVIADIVLRGAAALARNGVERAMVGRGYTPEKGAAVLDQKRTLGQTLVSAALARVASRSVPGAIVVGGGMLAKTLYDRHQDQRTRRNDKAKRTR
jgi:hypothetical protein